MQITFVVGLRGVGKSHFIADTFGPEFPNVVDFERFYGIAEDAGLDVYEASTAVKLLATNMLISMMTEKYAEIVVEFCAMSKVGQATLWAMMEIGNLYHYRSEVVYLKPKDYMAFKRTLRDEGASNMLSDFGGGHPRWREPSECPYFDVRTFVIDHTTWSVIEEGREKEEEVWEVVWAC